MQAHPGRRISGQLSADYRTQIADAQDTNTTQYELMKCFAKVNNGVSVVGDQDQSIYGWRSAEVENLNRMTRGELLKFVCGYAHAQTFQVCRRYISSRIIDRRELSWRRLTR